MAKKQRPPIKVSKRVIDNLPFKDKGQIFYWDSELKGFGVRVGMTCKTFVIQKDVKGKAIRATIGHYGIWTVEEAKMEAKENCFLWIKE